MEWLQAYKIDGSILRSGQRLLIAYVQRSDNERRIYFFDFDSKLASFIRRIASAGDRRSTGRVNISSQLISRIVLPVISFLTAPKSFDFLFIGQFNLMVNIAISIRVVVQSYKQKPRITTVSNQVEEAIYRWIARNRYPSGHSTLPNALKLNMVGRLQPYFVNVSKRLVKAPKLLFRDSGLLHYLANVTDYDSLLGNLIVGGSWESYVIEQIRRCVPESWQFFYYRTHAGAETDLVLIAPNGRKIGIKVKFSTAPTVSRGFYENRSDLATDHSYIIVPTGEKYPKANEVWVINVADFLANELPKLS